MITALLLVASIGPAAATVGSKAVNLIYSNISLTLDGETVRYENGEVVEPFGIDGTTYLPIRAIATALGLEVEWDGATNTVVLKHPSTVNPSQPSQGTPGNGNSNSGWNGAGTNPGGSGNADNFDTWDNPDQQNTSAKWVLNTSTLKIHYPRCSEVPRIAPHNYATSNLSEEELLAQGYSTCGRCH